MNEQFFPASDALGHSAPLEFRAQFVVLGVKLELRSNSPQVIAIAARAFDDGHTLPPELIAPLPPRRVDIVVHEEQTIDDRRWTVESEESPSILQSPKPQAPSPKPPLFTYRAHGETFVAARGATLLTAQMGQGTALGFVTTDMLADEANFRSNVLDLLALILASWHDRVPIHAGAVVHREQALLLVGPSLAGKSTLCFACLRAGFQLLAEDVVYVSREHGLRLWGHPRGIHLLPDAQRFFLDLAKLPASVQANGKLKLAVAVAAKQRRLTAEHALICLVQRRPGMASTLEPLAPAAAVAALCERIEPGFDLHRAQIPAVAAALVEHGAYLLHAGSDLGGAVALLKSLTE